MSASAVCGRKVTLSARTPCPFEPVWPASRRDLSGTVPAVARASLGRAGHDWAGSQRASLASTHGRRLARAVPRRPQSRAAGGRAHHRRAAARHRRRRLREDPRPHLSRRAPDQRRRCEAERDPRHHLHEQGGRRDEGAPATAARPHRPGALDPHLPRRVRPHPARARRSGSAIARTSRSTTRPTRSGW